jgi:copper oxidase (laccase) domain-containing protein
MTEQYGSNPADLLAAISPSLGPCCAEFINYKKELPEVFYTFMLSGDHFDFWQISRYQLCCAGLVESHIRTVGICTCCSPDYFSYRRASRTDGGVTGRNCSVIMLR